MNRPSTVVIAPRKTIHAIPASGMVPSKMESSSIKASKNPPTALICSAIYQGAKLTSTVLLSFAASATFWVFSPNFSCTKAKV